MDGLKVIKKDKSFEGWSKDKLIASLTKAGIEIKKAENIATSITNWARKKAKDGKIQSKQIRDKVIEKLKEIDPTASEEYRIFKA